jgi:hypothetical protein
VFFVPIDILHYITRKLKWIEQSQPDAGYIRYYIYERNMGASQGKSNMEQEFAQHQAEQLKALQAYEEAIKQQKEETEAVKQEMADLKAAHEAKAVDSSEPPQRKTIVIEEHTLWVETFNGMEIHIFPETQEAYSSENGDYLGDWDEDTKTLYTIYYDEEGGEIWHPLSPSNE